MASRERHEGDGSLWAAKEPIHFARLEAADNLLSIADTMYWTWGGRPGAKFGGGGHDEDFN